MLEKLNLEFFELCEQRHNTGADEYGPLKFLEVDLPEFIYEELADFANYARFLYIRVRILEEVANERGIDLSSAFAGEVRGDDKVPLGPATFIPQSKVSGFSPESD
jgi:hypothetical protein